MNLKRGVFALFAAPFLWLSLESGQGGITSAALHLVPTTYLTGGDGSEEPSPSSKKDDHPADFEGTVGIVDKPSQLAKQSALLKDVRLGRHPGYDRIVFEFQQAALPGYHTEYVDKPAYHCGSGEALWLAGDGWLSVSFRPAQAHDERGRSTVAYRSQLFDLPIVQEIQNICDFEGDLSWLLGVSIPNEYRVLELRRPTRLVIDIKH